MQDSNENENILQSMKSRNKKRDFKQYNLGMEIENVESITLQELNELKRDKFKLFQPQQSQSQQEPLSQNQKDYFQQKQLQINNNLNESQNKMTSSDQQQNKDEKIENEQLNNNKKITNFYMNRLYHHKEYKDSQHFITFRALFYEDPFYQRKNQRPKKSLISAFLTTKGLDEELVLPLIQANVKLVIADDKLKQWNEKRNIIRNHRFYEHFTIIYPPKDYLSRTWGCFHSKLWILKFPTFLRIVIGTGNLRVLHWTNWSNLVWFKDFPLCPILQQQSLNFQNSIESSCGAGSKGFNQINLENNYKSINDVDMNEDFVDILSEFIQKICPYFTIQEQLGIDLRSYLITGIDFMLVSSLPGKYSGPLINHYGKMRIRKICQIFNPKNSTSLGTIDRTFINEFLYCFLPYQFCSEIELSEKVKKNNPQKNDEIRLIFPSKDYIYNHTLDGPGYSCTLFLTNKRYSKESFLKNIFYQFECTQLSSLTLINSNNKQDDSEILTIQESQQQEQDQNQDLKQLQKSQGIEEQQSIMMNDQFENTFGERQISNLKDIQRNENSNDIIENSNNPLQLNKNKQKNKGIIPHFKTMIICEENNQINDDTIIYIGSHNFSEAAWGKLNNNNSQLYISNSELGILIPPLKGSKEMKQEIIEVMNYRFPAQVYTSKQKPYISDIDHPFFQK